MKYNIFLQHGWGWRSYDLWRLFLKEIPLYFNIFVLDRGYFENVYDWKKYETSYENNEAIPHIFICHSLGLHLIPPHWFEKIQFLVIISGFLSFHPVEPFEYKKSKRTIYRMLQKFREQPQYVLENFYQNCYLPNSSKCLVPSCFSKELLYKDLNLLYTSYLQREYLEKIPKIIHIYGDSDQIISQSVAQAMLLNIYQKQFIQEFIVKNGGHVLPLTHSNLCWKVIQKIWEL